MSVAVTTFFWINAQPQFSPHLPFFQDYLIVPQLFSSHSGTVIYFYNSVFLHSQGRVGHTLPGKALSHSKEWFLLDRRKYWVLPVSPPTAHPSLRKECQPLMPVASLADSRCLLPEPMFFACFKLPHRVGSWVCCDLSTLCCQQIRDRNKYFTGIKLALSSVDVIRFQPELLLGLFSPRR